MKRARAAALSVIFLLACGSGDLLRSFRSALAGFTPLAQSLQQQGELPADLVQLITVDGQDAIGCAETLETDFKVIPKDLPTNEVRVRKLNASVKAMRCWRPIVDRRNFAQHRRIQNAADIADGILASLVVFYSEPGVARASVAPRATVIAQDEQQLEEDLKRQVEALKKALKP